MRRIIKSHPPQELRKWCADNKAVNHSYECLQCTAAHAALKRQLLEEQGSICAYTGILIDAKSSHVEHVKPQNKCSDWEDVEYRNMIACFPENGGDTSHGYGAPVKGGWWEPAKFVSPLSEECERRFRFAWSGHVYPFPAEDEAATETIKVLNLDHEDLCKLRKKRIDGFFGFGARTRNRPLSVADAEIALARIDRIGASGVLTEFCFVLKQLLVNYINPPENAG